MQNTACDAGDKDSATGLGKSHGEANGNPVQYSYLENSMDRGAWWAIVHRVAERQIQLTNETTTIYKKMSLGHKKGIHVNQLNWGRWTSSLLYRMKLEREKQILYINAYVWSLGKWYQWNYLQSRNRGGENRSVAGKERAGWTEEAHWHACTVECETGGWWELAVSLRESSPGLCASLEGWRGRVGGASEGRGRVYSCGWFTLLRGRSQHNIVEQLPSS